MKSAKQNSVAKKVCNQHAHPTQIQKINTEDYTLSYNNDALMPSIITFLFQT